MERKADVTDLAADQGTQPRKPSGQILALEVQEALDALDRSADRLFFSGIAAGLEIGFSLYLMAIILYRSEGRLPEPVVDLLVANMYAFGFILVVLGRSELFTEQTSLAVMPALGGRASLLSVARLWAIIWSANLIGAAAFAALAVVIGIPLGSFDQKSLGMIAGRMVEHPGWVILLSGILAGWLMGLLSWLVAAGRDTISQFLVVWLIASAIGLSRLHHCVLGTAEVLAGVFSSAGTTLADYLHFLLWTTLGNAIGGPIFVALLKTSIARRETP